MTDPGTPSRAAQLRRAFDAGFAAPLPPPRAPSERLLLVVVGEETCAVPMAECSGVERAPRITGLPARRPAFRGLAAVGGAVLPVYDLAAQLGLAAAARQPWLLVSAGHQRVAFLVAAVEGYADVEDAGGVEADGITVPVAGVPRRLIRLAALIDRLAREAPAGTPEE